MGKDSSFELNRAYKNKHIKFKISSVKETEKESKEVYQFVEEDRKIFLQALLVRIMKARKVLHHNDLVIEVTKQATSRFIPTVSMIKKQIEYLMEKEYIQRVEGETSKYSYIA